MAAEIRQAIQDPEFDGYYIALQMYFLGRRLAPQRRELLKLSLFRRGKGRYECRLKDQDASMADMEVHEHVVVDGKRAGWTSRSCTTMSNLFPATFRKHDEYSNWEARVWLQGESRFE